MNRIAAYIEAVKTNLPKAQREDLGDELRSLLEESHEAALGKSAAEASEAETIAWLKTREHPALLASRYHTRRVLIDEDSFPLYKLALRYALIGIALAHIGASLFAALSSGHYVLPVFSIVSSIVHVGLLAFAAITLTFHFFSQHLRASAQLARWDPRDLPDPSHKWAQEPYADSIAGLVFTAIFALFINGMLGSFIDGASGHRFQSVAFNFMPEAAKLLPWINGVLLGSILLYAALIARPRWSILTLAASAALSFGVAAICGQLLTVTPLIEIVSKPAATRFPDQETLLAWIDISLRIGLIIVVSISLFEAMRSLWRMGRLGKGRLL